MVTNVNCQQPLVLSNRVSISAYLLREINAYFTALFDEEKKLFIHKFPYLNKEIENFTQDGPKLKQITDEVINKFWRNSGDRTPPKQTEIVSWIMEKYGVPRTSAKAIDKVSRPESAKRGGTRPLK
jgi:hypothetical protein